MRIPEIIKPILFFLLLILFPVVSSSSTLAEPVRPKVALVMKALTNPFFSKMKKGAEEYAIEHQISLETFGIERETDVDYQITIMENLISRGYKAIVIAPADSKLLIPVIKKAQARGIVVINIDNPLHRNDLIKENMQVPFVGSDNKRGAGMVGDYVRRKLDGQGKVFVIEGIRGVENADLRKEGFIEAVTRDSQIRVVASESANWHTDEAFAVTAKLLEEHSNVDAIFCANDSMALGALNALETFDLKGKTMVVGYDNIDAVRNEMQNGFIQATVEQHPELMGAHGVRLAVDGLAGRPIPDQVVTRLDLITCEFFGRKVGLSISELNNPFFMMIRKGILEDAEMFGLKLIIADAKNDPAQQLADIEQLVQKKVEALILNPTNSQLIVAGVELANAAGIPVLTVDRIVSEGQIAGHIASNNILGGKMAADFIAEQLGGKGSVLEIEGIPGTSACHERGKGFNEAMRHYPEIKFIARETGDFDRERGKAVMKKVLSSSLTIDAVFAHNDSMALGALDALEESGSKHKPIMVGFDGILEARNAVKEGRLSATIAQRPKEMGQLALAQALAFMSGRKPDQEEISIDLELVTR